VPVAAAGCRGRCTHGWTGRVSAAVAKAALRAPRRVCGGARDPLDDWIREDAAALVGNYSIHQPGVARTRFGGQLVQVLQAPLAAQVTRVVNHGLDSEGAILLKVDLDPRVLEGQVDGDVAAAVQQPGGEEAELGEAAGDRDDLLGEVAGLALGSANSRGPEYQARGQAVAELCRMACRPSAGRVARHAGPEPAWP
jgi:hypothetical protein